MSERKPGCDETHLRLFVENSPVAIAMFDRTMRYLAASQRWIEDYRLTEANLLGLSHYDVFPEIPDRWKVLHRRGLAGETLHALEDRFPRRDGSVQWLRWELQPWHEPDGAVGGIVVFTEDITARKQAEADRANLEEQLRQSQKMEAVGRLAGGVAHDFNNMLSVIIGRAEQALIHPELVGSLRTSLEEILKAATRSADITRQLLAFARKQSIVPGVYDLNEILEGMLKMLRRMVREEIEFSVHLGSNLWPILIDRGQVDQILANLTVNAGDAIAGVGRITIETKNLTVEEGRVGSPRGLAAGQYVVLTFADDGAGMDRAVLDHIFEPFFTTKDHGKGTGLGLATVYGIVRQNLGDIRVESEPGRGTTFTVAFPRYSGQPVDRPPDAAPATLKPDGKTILLVEDEEMIVDLARSMLDDLGFAVLTAGTPEDALRLVAGHAGPIDVLITDVVMPGMNGFDLAARIKALRPGLKCLLMSGYTADLLAPPSEGEAVTLLQKPFTRTDLLLCLEKVLDRA